MIWVGNHGHHGHHGPHDHDMVIMVTWTTVRRTSTSSPLALMPPLAIPKMARLTASSANQLRKNLIVVNRWAIILVIVGRNKRIILEIFCSNRTFACTLRPIIAGSRFRDGWPTTDILRGCFCLQDIFTSLSEQNRNKS